MAGYIGSKANVSQIDGYVKSEVDTLLGQELNLSGGSMTGHLNFGDNIKIQSGAGTDLQIYHDASHSYIKDAGDGSLRLSASTVEIMKVDTSELMASFAQDGAVTLYYDNAAKLATNSGGVDVTGTVTADGLTNSGTSQLDGSITLGVAGSSNGYINSPSGIFVNIDSDNNQTDRFFDIRKDSTDGSGALLFQVLESGATTINGNVTLDAGTTTSLIIEKNGTGSGRVAFHNEGTQLSYISLDAAEDMVYYAGSGVDQIFYAHGAQALTLASSGEATFNGVVEIGTSSGTQPSYFHSFLNVQNNVSTGSNASVTITSGSGGFAGLHFGDSDNGRIGQIAYNNADNSLLFTSNNSTRMTLDASGNLMVGKTALNDAVVGVELRASGIVVGSAASNVGAVFNRNSSDGAIVSLKKAGAEVGSIGVSGGNNLYISSSQTNHAGLTFATDAILPTRQGATTNGVTDLGASSEKFKDLHLSGTVNSYRMKVSTASSGASAHANADEIIAESNGDAGISILSGQSNKGALFFGDAGVNTDGRVEYSQANRAMTFATAGSDAVTINSSGNVGIGTASPDNPLEVVGANSGIKISAGSSDRPMLRFECGSDEKLILSSNTAYGAIGDGSDANRYMAFKDGNVLVGKTASNGATAGNEFLASGRHLTTVNNTTCAIINRLSSDGTILLFEKDSSAVGSIGTVGTDLYIGTGDTGLRFLDSSNAIIPIDTSSENTRDDAISFGTASARYDNIYATNGTIQTSDRNEKQNIEELSDAERRVAIAAKSLLRKFKWKSAVTSKGDKAQIHFGIIAQDLQTAFAAESLDAGDYGMITSDTWTDDDGNEKTRLGVRYSELLAFIISAI